MANSGIRLGEINEPTIAKLASRIAGRLNCLVLFDDGIDTSLQITHPFEALTVYEGIQILAICCGGYCVNNNAGNIVVKRFLNIPTLTVDTGMMVELPVIAEQYTVDSISCAVSEATYDEEGNPVDAVYATSIVTGLKTEYDERLKTHSNQYIDARYPTMDADIQLSCKWVTENIFALNIQRIIGYSYYPAEINLTLGDPRLEGCDVLRVVDSAREIKSLVTHSGDRITTHSGDQITARTTDANSNSYVVPCHKIIHSYTGGFSSEIHSADANDKANNIGSSTPITSQLARISREVDSAYKAGNEALMIAGNNNQYFWFTESGNDTGAHITETPQEQFLADPQNGGGNLLARSNGVAVRDGLTELAVFGLNLLRIGRADMNRAMINSDTLQMFDTDNTKYFEVSAESITYGSKVVASTDDVEEAEENASKVATNYIGVNSAGLHIAESNPLTATKKVHLTANGVRVQQSADDYIDVLSSGLDVRVDGDSVANFGATARIGLAGDERVEVVSDGVKIYDPSNDLCAWFGSSHLYMYGGNGTYPLVDITSSDITIAEDATHKIVLGSDKMSIYEGSTNPIAQFGSTVTIGYEAGGHTIIQSSGMQVYSGSNGSVLLANIGYGTGNAESGTTETNPYFTFGTRASNASADIGNYSMTEGYSNTASGRYSYAGGIHSVANGVSSFARGMGAYANGADQTVIGTYNVIEGSPYVHDGNAFIIGCGAGDQLRMNAFTVSWQGDIETRQHANIGGHLVTQRYINSGGPIYINNRSFVNIVDFEFEDTRFSSVGINAIGVNITKTGYTPIGVIGFRTELVRKICLASYEITEGSTMDMVNLYIINFESDQIITDMHLRVLYVAEGQWG